jgi:hypothetical protein
LRTIDHSSEVTSTIRTGSCRTTITDTSGGYPKRTSTSSSIDRAVKAVKQVFLKLHETGHAVLPWQRNLYSAIEDGEQELDPDIADLFDREANVFATEVLFQLDSFTEEAASYDFGIGVPLKLSRKYGSSAYAAVRQYVAKNHRDCVVLVLDPPSFTDGDGLRASLRRPVASRPSTRSSI